MCRGWADENGPCGASDCLNCYPGGDDEDEDKDKEYETTKSVVRVARKDRFVGKPYEIRRGDIIRVVSGFTYREGGERTGYLPKRYSRVWKGPAWAVVD